MQITVFRSAVARVVLVAALAAVAFASVAAAAGSVDSSAAGLACERSSRAPLTR